jgi:hypothetical protein
MSWEQFDAQLTHIEDQAAARRERAEGYYDQHLARLFVDSEQSQQELADHLAKRWGRDVSRRWVGYHLCFGRFLTFFGTTCAEYSVPEGLTEGKFRGLWEPTRGEDVFDGKRANTEAAAADERRRFALVAEEVKDYDCARKRTPVRQAIIKKVAGRDAWLTAAQIAQKVSGEFDRPVSAADVKSCLSNFTPTEKQPYRVEKAGDGENARYRVVKVRGKIVGKRLIAQWAHELIPLLDLLVREAQKNRVEVSLSALCELATKIRKVMEAVVAEAPSAD